MRRLLSWLAMLALAATLSLAQLQEAREPRFEPVEIVSAADFLYPVRSVAFGTVVLQVTVEPDGVVGDVKVVKDIKSLTPEALRCVKKWKFKPARLDGKPIRSTMAVAFTFNVPFIGNP